MQGGIVLNQFVVEANKETVGVAVRVPGGFRFFYSDPRFSGLDGQIFRRGKQLARTVGKLAQKKGVGRLDEAFCEKLAFH
ncbi:hypothetical protein KRR38_31855 [Novosphingobium sp. G106]|uniref:hypothetical protein n=1 Tax=Novosphingobium sp. G106 TaxID=2849500 RepID=UPI001C2DBC69|nr:hypothetical protein [Novosphingobium sp. G106]MBV1692140.1 hypothetical protein [Novosphingobium sp. G106]